MIDNTRYRHNTFKSKPAPTPAAANATSPESTATTATAATRAETTPAAPPSGGKSAASAAASAIPSATPATHLLRPNHELGKLLANGDGDRGWPRVLILAKGDELLLQVARNVKHRSLVVSTQGQSSNLKVVLVHALPEEVPDVRRGSDLGVTACGKHQRRLAAREAVRPSPATHFMLTYLKAG